MLHEGPDVIDLGIETLVEVGIVVYMLASIRKGHWGRTVVAGTLGLALGRVINHTLGVGVWN
jgi:hypothetical protein